MENELDVIEASFTNDVVVEDILQPENVVVENNNAEYIKYLQHVIELLQANPEMPEVGTQINLWVYQAEVLPFVLKMLGNYRKEYSEYIFTAKKNLTKNYYFGVQCSRNNVCREKIVGKKIVEKEVFNPLSPEDQKLLDELRAKQYVKQMVEEPIKEWDCGPTIVHPATKSLTTEEDNNLF